MYIYWEKSIRLNLSLNEQTHNTGSVSLKYQALRALQKSDTSFHTSNLHGESVSNIRSHNRLPFISVGSGDSDGIMTIVGIVSSLVSCFDS